ncbi:methyltransferase domain-containing protein [Roseovarius sp. SCSIO 43702]|uniref:RsmB/NOP family class I SAM-dependent RNA methyltransferase n=1 Tax=Roseovarius sp. SCSIO 43702 TaxID=2823043 RepID=UPI001C73CD35|nr:transcription antitermination factor NusB [Roseovarius sp. SCSIO 43702]QYX57048.1 methyltransferase domain-containing protein [Roseovarius sp. SCSIO 43702]
MATPPASARKSAVWLMDQVMGEHRMLADILARGGLDRLPPEGRARAQRLTLETLRGLERADRLISRHVRRKPPLHIRNILRVATVELAHGGDAHGVVGEAVTLAAGFKRGANYKSLVNAVLRKIAVEAPRSWNDLRTPRLPDWLRRPLIAAYGPGAVAAMEAAHLAGAPLDLTAKSDAGAVADLTGGTVLPTGSIRIDTPGQVSAMAGYDTGDWWVQDAAAALPARILAAQEGERVLDLCAAPGGKTMQLAASGARVTALDISQDRMARVIENLKRTNLEADCRVEDALAHEDGPYDAILLDAPCSATGTIRRHPDLPHARTGDEIDSLIALQAAMINHALSLLKPEGRLLFCTCSLLPDEGECQIDEAIARHPGLRTDREALNLPGIDPSWITEEGGVRLRPDYWPDRGGMDGFYMALLRR